MKLFTGVSYFFYFCSSSAMPMVESAMAVAVMSRVSMVSWSAQLRPVTHSKSVFCVQNYTGFWVRDRCVIPFSPAISSVFSSVAYILSAVPNVLSLISAVLDAIQRSALVLSVSHILSAVSHIFSTIPDVFTSVSDVLPAVSAMPRCWLCC